MKENHGWFAVLLNRKVNVKKTFLNFIEKVIQCFQKIDDWIKTEDKKLAL